MVDPKGPYRVGATFLGLAGVLYLGVFALSIGSGDMMRPAVWAAAMLLLAFGLFQGSRVVAYIAFLAALIALVFSVGQLWTPAPLSWLYMIITACNIIAALGLFAALWRPARATAR